MPGLIEEIGKKLWGVRWQQEMATAVVVKPRTIRRWNSGDTVVPRKYWQKLKNIARDRRSDAGVAVELIKMHQAALAAGVPAITAIKDAVTVEVAAPEPAVDTVVGESAPRSAPPLVLAVSTGSAPVRGGRPEVTKKRRLRPPQREKVLLALTAADVTIDDECIMAVVAGGEERCKVRISHSDPEHRLHMRTLDRRGRWKDDKLYDPTLFVRVVSRPGV